MRFDACWRSQVRQHEPGREFEVGEHDLAFPLVELGHEAQEDRDRFHADAELLAGRGRDHALTAGFGRQRYLPVAMTGGKTPSSTPILLIASGILALAGLAGCGGKSADQQFAESVAATAAASEVASLDQQVLNGSLGPEAATDRLLARLARLEHLTGKDRKRSLADWAGMMRAVGCYDCADRAR